MENEKSNRQVVITGMGVVSPLGCGVNLFWEKLLAGQSGVKLITEFDLSRCKTKIGASAAGFYP
ncbi:MAG: beta-ketoacyl-[acyl-carrier-protein] synthase II, partial [Anaerolineae bacterium]|nr:beta-ketoacyl-[acyl-carrier-protein] synthase II [Anaerolineae bacterium]